MSHSFLTLPIQTNIGVKYCYASSISTGKAKKNVQEALDDRKARQEDLDKATACLVETEGRAEVMRNR